MENEEHCDFVKLREAMLRINEDSLRERTHSLLYERYRRQRLQEMKLRDGDAGPKMAEASIMVGNMSWAFCCNNPFVKFMIMKFVVHEEQKLFIISNFKWNFGSCVLINFIHSETKGASRGEPQT